MSLAPADGARAAHTASMCTRDGAQSNSTHLRWSSSSAASPVMVEESLSVTVDRMLRATVALAASLPMIKILISMPRFFIYF